MGAPFLNWLFRAVIAAACLVGVAVLASLPLAAPVRAALVLLALAAVIVVAFRFVPAFDLLGRVRWRLPRLRDTLPRCALTFDDGPSEATDAVLDILASEGVRATFFVLGLNARRHPEMVRRIQAEGHAVGLHGMSHGKVGGAREEAIERELDELAATLDGLGISPGRIYRTPHGRKSRAVFAVARRRGLTMWAWSRGVWDTAGPAPQVLERRATRLAGRRMVLLLHDGRGEEPSPNVSAMLASLPGIIRRLKERGFAFVRLTDV